MEGLEELFGGEALTYDALRQKLKEKGSKLVDLSSGQYVDKAKLEGKIAELAAANHTIQNLRETVKQFDGVDVEGLKKAAKDWQEKYEKDLAAGRRDAALDGAILKAKGKNPKAIKALLDLENIKLKEDGTLEGLDLEGLKKTDGYLFDEETTVQQGTGNPASSQGQPPSGFDRIIHSARTGAGLKD